MAKKPKQPKAVETFTYDDASRKNIPTAEHQSLMEKAQQTPLRVAYERRNRDLDLDPQRVRRGKDDRDSEGKKITFDYMLANPPFG